MALPIERSEAAALARLLQVSLSPPSTSEVLYLPELSKDLAAKREAQADAAPSGRQPFTADVAEAALVERLGLAANSTSIPAPGNSVHYCAAVYGRADAEARRLPAPAADAAAAALDPVSKANEEWRDVLERTKQLALTYCSLAAFSGAFPAACDLESKSASPLVLPSPLQKAPKTGLPRAPALLLLDMMDAAVASSAGGLAGIAGARLPFGAVAGAPPAPPGFLDAFAQRWNAESPDELSDLLAAVARECGSRLRRAKSPLGEWQPAMRHLLELASSPAAAAALVRCRSWLPLPLVNGAVLEKSSLLGPAFAVSIVFSPRGQPDHDEEDDEFEDEGPSAWPEEMQQSVGALVAWVESGDYSDAEADDGVLPSSSSSSSSPSSVAAATASDTLLRAQGDVRGALRAIVMTLLRSKGENVRERTMAWLSAALNANRERGKLSPDPRKASSAGFALNVEAALLDACAPFAEPAFRSRRAWGKVRARALADGKVDWMGDTRVALDEPAALAWSRAVKEKHRAFLAASSSSSSLYSYHFVCDAFWAAAKSSSYGSCGVAAQAQQLRARAAHTDDVARQLDQIAAVVSSGGALPVGAPPIPPGGEAAAARRFASQAAQHRQVAGSMRVYARVLDLGAAAPLMPSRSSASSSSSSSSSSSGSSGSSAVDFAGLVAAWTMRLAMLGEAAEDEAEEGEGAKEPTPSPAVAIPLPPPSESFRALPEEIFTALSWVMCNAPEDVVCACAGSGGGNGGGSGGSGSGGSGPILDDVLKCVVALIASPDHVRNPYIRAQLFSLLHVWVVKRGSRVVRRGTRVVGLPAARAHSLVLSRLDADPLLRAQTVPSILRLYADIEDASRNAAFQEKFELRLRASQVLAALWRGSGGGEGAGGGGGGHQRAAWLAVADEAAGGAAGAAEVAESVYGRFMHFLLTDAIYLLDQALEKLKLIAAHEKASAEGGGGGGGGGGGSGGAGSDGQQPLPSDQEVAEASRFVPAALDLSAACLDTLRYSTADPRGAAPWLTRGMVQRTADALNYFLAALVGPARRGLRVRDPAALRWDPKALLVSLATVYVHLAAAADDDDGDGGKKKKAEARGGGGGGGGGGGDATISPFAAAVAADARSFSRRLFPDALAVLRGLALLPQASLEALERFAAAADAAADAADREAEAAASAPEEFLDPITGEVMADPVRLPASGQVVDSSSLARALMSKAVDPFSNTPLRMEEAEVQPELAARIREWREGLTRKKF